MGTGSKTVGCLWDILIPQNEGSQKYDGPTTKSQIIYPTLTTNSLNIILRTDKRASDLATYLHATCFSPVKHTFLNTIKKFLFLTWPGLTPSLIQKYLVLPQSIILGHIKQEKHSLHSTKPHLKQNKLYKKSNDMIYAIIQNNNKAFMDLTGRFPYKSSRGNEYILISFHVDSNAILGTPV